MCRSHLEDNRGAPDREVPEVILQLSLSLFHTVSLSLSLSLIFFLTHSLSLSLSLTHTHTVSLSLSLSHTHTHLSLSPLENGGDAPDREIAEVVFQLSHSEVYGLGMRV